VTGPEGLDHRSAGHRGWDNSEHAGGGGPDFARMIEALRLVQDRVTAASPPHAVVTEVAGTLEKLAATLEPFAVGEADQITGHRSDLPGRGQAMAPTVHVDEWDARQVRGRVTLGRFYLGGGGAAHGGVLPLVFDEVLGRLANTGRSRSRTAYLHVNYRKITPIGPELRVQAEVQREEGRKRFLTGAIYHGDTLTADAEGLFVALRPGQP
jgi:acyl-coenzyme A thioesterase PaaI-like protein